MRLTIYEMGGACGTGGGEFWWGSIKERDHVKGLGINGRIILVSQSNQLGGAWTGFNLAQDTDKWRAFLKAVRKL
jgi:hypothetical protein